MKLQLITSLLIPLFISEGETSFLSDLKNYFFGDNVGEPSNSNCNVELKKSYDVPNEITAELTYCNGVTLNAHFFNEHFNETFGNVTRLRFSKCIIKKIGNKAFTTFSNLYNLRIANSTIKRIDTNPFGKLRKLQYLHLNNNVIPSRISLDCFKGLTQLRSFTLTNATINVLNATVFHRSHELKYLVLDGNQIETITGVMPHLWMISLENNKLSKLNATAFNGWESLEKINLKGNNLTGDTFAELKKKDILVLV